MAGFDFEFDFDQWRELAERDPAAFFAARRALLERFIAAAPARLSQDLRNLQSAVDCYRAEAGSPDLAAERLMGMLFEHLSALSGHMQQLREQSVQLAELLPRE